MIDFCCLLEVRWRGQGSKMLGWREEDVICGFLGIVMELVVWELW